MMIDARKKIGKRVLACRSGYFRLRIYGKLCTIWLLKRISLNSRYSVDFLENAALDGDFLYRYILHRHRSSKIMAI